MHHTDPAKLSIGKALGRVPSGVYVLTASHGGRAAAMLAASKDSAEKAPTGSTESETSGALVLPSSFSLGPGVSPDQHALILSFGQSHVAFSMPEPSMRSLGESMVTLTTRGSAH